ncbi:structural cement protein Gp24 [Dickeya oryzae]
MANSFLYRMPAGIAGSISRPQDLTVETQLLDSTNLFSAYGLGGKISSGKFVPIAASDTAAVLAGIFVRPYPTASQPDKVQQVGSGKNFTGDSLVRGYVTVNIGSDASGVALRGPVYMRVASPSASSPLGAFLATADGSNTVQITNAYFNGPGDTSGNIELAYNI